MSGNLDLVKFLTVEKQIDPNLKSFSSGSKPIHVATTGGNTSIVEYLITEQGCDPLEKDKNGEDCLCLAIKNKRRAVASCLIKTNRFPLEKIMEIKGFNYFAYSLVKGQHVTADEIH